MKTLIIILFSCLMSLTQAEFFNNNSSSSSSSEFCEELGSAQIKFSYETIGGDGLYSKTGSGIYKYRKTITKYAGPIDQQIQQVQQQQIFVPPNLESENVPIQTEINNETSTSPILDWKLIVPKNTFGIWIGQIQDSKVLKSYQMSKTDLSNRSITIPNADYTKSINITGLGIIPDGWYGICVDLNMVFGKIGKVCRQCTLLRASVEDYPQKAFTMKILSKFTMPDSIRIEYDIEDIPFSKATLITKAVAYPDESSNRCVQSDLKKSIITSNDVIYPNTIVLIDLEGLSAMQNYKITSTLVSIDLGKDSFSANDYLGDESSMFNVAKCSHF